MAEAPNKGWTAAEAVEKVEAGILCKGIFLTDNVVEITKEREPVIKVKDNLQFKGARSIQEKFRKEFKSQNALEIFEKNIDKCASSRSTTASLWGISIEGEGNKRKKHKAQQENVLYIANYEMVPITAVNLTTNDLELLPEVIKALQEIDKSLKPTYKPKGHFREFFEKFGSHVNYGVIELGGILMSIVQSEDFSEDERLAKTNEASEVTKSSMRNIFVDDDDRMEGFGDMVVSLIKIGGSPESPSKIMWKRSLEEHSLCRVINRSSQPKPIWELLGKHKDQFEKPLVLAKVMQEEWEIHNHVENQGKYEDITKLRQNRDIWLELSRDQDAVSCLKKLVTLRQELDVSSDDWRDQVIYSPEVQSVLASAAQHKKNSSDPLRKQQIASLLEKILHPVDQIQISHFPDLNYIVSLDHSENLDITEPFQITCITDLPSVILECYAEEMEHLAMERKCKVIQSRLEATIKYWSKKYNATYEYLLCLCILRQNDFDTKSFRFEYSLSEEDISEIVDKLAEHFNHLETIQQTSKKQAYLLSLTLDCKTDTHTAVEEMFYAIPGGICPEIMQLKEEAKRGDLTCDLAKFKKDLCLFLEGRILNVDEDALIESLKMQLKMDYDEAMVDNFPQEQEGEVDKTFEEILEVLGMKKYYPQKLTYGDVIQLTADMRSDSPKRPSVVSDLPWYFLRQIVALDSSARDYCHVTSFQGDRMESSDSSGSDSDMEISDSDASGDGKVSRTDQHSSNGHKLNDDESSTDQITSVHPLDLIYIIFLCADDFLRQELVDKMVKCQYSVPFILPSPKSGTSTFQSLILHWALKSLTRSFCENE